MLDHIPFILSAFSFRLLALGFRLLALGFKLLAFSFGAFSLKMVWILIVDNYLN